LLINEYIQNRKNSRKIAKELGCSHSTVLYWLRKHKIKRRPKGHPRVLPNLTITPNLCYGIGVVKGDGCITKSGVVLNVKDYDFAKSFYKSLKEIGVKPTLHKHQLWTVTGCSVILSAWFQKITLAQIGKIVDQSRANTIKFLKGFYESEGCLYTHWTYNGRTKKKYRYLGLRIYNTDEELMVLVRHFVEVILGFKYKIQCRRYSKSGFKKTGTEYSIQIVGSGASRFLNIIKPCVKKIKALEGVRVRF